MTLIVKPWMWLLPGCLLGIGIGFIAQAMSPLPVAIAVPVGKLLICWAITFGLAFWFDDAPRKLAKQEN